MPCDPLPAAPIPSLPAGITLAAPVPALPAPPDLQAPCCTLPALPALDIPNPLGPLIVNPAFITAMRAALLAAEDYANSLPLLCPRQ